MSHGRTGRLPSIKQFLETLIVERPASEYHVPRNVLLEGVSAEMVKEVRSVVEILAGEMGRKSFHLDFREILGGPMIAPHEDLAKRFGAADESGRSFLLVAGLEVLAVRDGSGSGIGNRLHGILLRWLAERTSEAIVICMADDPRRLPPEYRRIHRFPVVQDVRELRPVH